MSMSKLKKEAQAAIGVLKKYLRRDRNGSNMVNQVDRYMVALRKGYATAKAHADDLEQSRNLLDTTCSEQAGQISELRRMLEEEKMRHRQALGDLARAEDRIAELTKEPEDISWDYHTEEGRQEISRYMGSTLPNDGDLPGWIRETLKRLRKRMPKPPKRIYPENVLGYKGGVVSPVVFSMEDVMKKYTSDEYITLGLFIAFMAYQGYLAFPAPTYNRDLNKWLGEEFTVKLHDWLGPKWLSSKENNWKIALTQRASPWLLGKG